MDCSASLVCPLRHTFSHALPQPEDNVPRLQEAGQPQPLGLSLLELLCQTHDPSRADRLRRRSTLLAPFNLGHARSDPITRINPMAVKPGSPSFGQSTKLTTSAKAPHGHTPRPTCCVGVSASALSLSKTSPWASPPWTSPPQGRRSGEWKSNAGSRSQSAAVFLSHSCTRLLPPTFIRDCPSDGSAELGTKLSIRISDRYPGPSGY
ncbi:hypothetical protein VTJ83DRAFT_1635 [Remersonia thermophila]|uniref:Uncharacterized protein n=1 Tax=Remersonia thermophila TaxID=72144 RepID=A0ABR4DHZ3_9PEZI